MKKAISSLVLLLLWVTANTIAQECPDYVSQTLAEVAENCADLARNQICYGNVEITVESNADVLFEEPGDIINVADVEALHVTAQGDEIWGVALMSLQADLPYTLPGQNVTVLLFGDMSMEVDESLRAYTFSGGIGQPSCEEAPNGIVLQSPEGYSAAMTINGSRVEFGSTILLQYQSDSMTVTTLAGVANIMSEEGRQTVPQGSQSSISLDDNQVNAAPSSAKPIDAEALIPYVEAVNNSGMMLTTYEDAAANPRIQELVNEGILPVLDENNPIIGLSQAEIDAAVEALNAQIIPIPSGQWRMVSQEHEVTGTCIDSTSAGVADGGGDAGEEYRIPICGLAEQGAIATGSNPMYMLGFNVYGDEYTDEQPNFGAGEGTVVVTNRWEYRVISETQIEMTFTSVEEGGCTFRSVFIYELAEEDEAVCDDVIMDMSRNGSDGSEEIVLHEIQAGVYSTSDFYQQDCDFDVEALMETLEISLDADGLSVTIGEDTYTLDDMSGVYLYYEGTLTVAAVALDENSLSISYMDGNCMAFGTYQPE